jgi:hypothetical protein
MKSPFYPAEQNGTKLGKNKQAIDPNPQEISPRIIKTKIPPKTNSQSVLKRFNSLLMPQIVPDATKKIKNPSRIYIFPL